MTETNTPLLVCSGSPDKDIEAIAGSYRNFAEALHGYLNSVDSTLVQGPAAKAFHESMTRLEESHMWFTNGLQAASMMQGLADSAVGKLEVMPEAK